MAVELGAGYVSVVPAWEGGTKGATSSLGGADIGKQLGGQIGTGLAAALGAAGIGVGIAAAVGVGLFKVGDSFDEQFDKIRVATGETGDALAGLQTDFKDVLKSVPTDFASAGDAVAGLTQKLDLVGKPLQDRAKQFLELSRITGTDLSENLEAGTDALQAWQISAEDQGDTLDLLFRASQESGAAFSDLTSSLADNSTVFKALGFDVEQATTVLAGLAKGGLEAGDVMPALGKAIAAGAKNGKSAQDVYQGLIREIKEAPDATKAAGIAYDTLGAKAGPKFAALVRSGKFSFDQLGESIAEGSDTILAAGEDTQDFAEKFELLKNRVLVGIEPLATRVFDAIGSGMDSLGPIFDTVTSGISTVVSVFQTDGLGGIGTLIETQAPIIGEKLLGLGATLYEWVQPQIEPMLGKLGEFLQGAVEWILSDGIPLLADGVAVLIPAMSDWLLGDGTGEDDSALGQLMTKAGEFLKSLVDWIIDTDDGLAGALFEGGKEAGAALAEGIWEGAKEAFGSTFSPFGKGYEVHIPGTPFDFELAGGGTARSGEVGIVGENGPELFAPGVTGRVFSNRESMAMLTPAASGGGGGPTLVVQQLPGEDQITAGMRALKWHSQVQMAMAG